MSGHEVSEPIINSPYDEPRHHWYLREGEAPVKRPGRRPPIVYPPREQRELWDLSDGTLKPSKEYAPGYEMVLVGLIEERVKKWRAQGYPGVTRTTLELLEYWRRDGRDKRLFFAQIAAVETIIFLREARPDFLQGIGIPTDEPSEQQKAEGARAFARQALKMATGSGKTTVMGMLAAWSVLNKINNRSDGRFSDVVLVVCPNITIKNRLGELDPNRGDASIYRTRDLVPTHLMDNLRRGRVLITNWHLFELQTPQTGGVSAKVTRVGRPARSEEVIYIGRKTTTARGKRYMTSEDLERQMNAGVLSLLGDEKRDTDGTLRSVHVRLNAPKYVESDTAWIDRVLGKEIGGKQNVLVMNDEAHHAYRIRREEQEETEEDLFGEEEAAEDFYKEATIWVEGLDRIQKHRGINLCIDLSATPFFLGRVGQETNKPFPWVVFDFGLIEAIESGLVKIPQLVTRDTTGQSVPSYFNIWDWVLDQLTPAERGPRKGSPKPEAVLKYAHHPIAMLAGEWQKELERWAESADEPRPPVFIIVCKNTRIAKVMYEWIAEGAQFHDVPPFKMEGLRNRDGQVNTIRVDTKVVHETDVEGAKSDEFRWMRLTLDTVGKTAWPSDTFGRPIYPEGFEELAKKLNRPLHPPGRDIRSIVSVGMLTEGWDCNTVTHIIGLRPFMSQLLCEQVVGRGLRRARYEPGPDGKFTEELAKVFGVPFEVIPFKASPVGPAPPAPKRNHVHAIPGKSEFKITYPRVEGYTQAIRNRIAVDWPSVPALPLQPGRIPPEVEVKAMSLTNEGRMSLSGPGKVDEVTLREFRSKLRKQELIFDLAQGLTRQYVAQRECDVPAHTLFPQLVQVIRRYLDEKVKVQPPADIKDLFLAPYYGWLVEMLESAIGPDTSAGDVPEVPVYEAHRSCGSTEDVDFWTGKDVRECLHCHVNYVVADTKRWEQSAAYYIDKHPATAAFVKNEGLGFAIPYFHDGQQHDYMPDFIVRLKTEEGQPEQHLILEVKGFDELRDVKRAAADRWVNAINADGTYGHWEYAIADKPEQVNSLLNAAMRTTASRILDGGE
jgi:type III restriction enzyme